MITGIGHDFLAFIVLKSTEICFCHLSLNPESLTCVLTSHSTGHQQYPHVMRVLSSEWLRLKLVLIGLKVDMCGCSYRQMYSKHWRVLQLLNY